MRALTDAAGTVTDESSYDAWGEPRSTSGATPNAHGYKGEFLAYRGDPDAGPETVYSLHRRDYVAGQGRFKSEDPEKADSNDYRYVHNDPVNRVDPSGLQEPAPRTAEALDQLLLRGVSSRRCVVCHWTGVATGHTSVSELPEAMQWRIYHWTNTANPYDADIVVAEVRRAYRSRMARIEGASRVAAGTTGGIISAGLTETGVGAIVGVPGLAWSADQIYTGAGQVVYGDPRDSLGGQAIKSVAGDGWLGKGGGVRLRCRPVLRLVRPEGDAGRYAASRSDLAP